MVEKLLENEAFSDALFHEKELSDIPSSHQDNGIKVNRKWKKKQDKIKADKEKRMNGVIMGKLHKDMMFLEKLAYHPELTKDLLDKKYKKQDQKGNLVQSRNICGTAKDGLSFLHVRKEFWETSESSAATVRNRNVTKKDN